MDVSSAGFGERSRLRLLLDRLSTIEDGRDAHRVAYPLSEIMLLSVCGAIADCDDYDDIADWGRRTWSSCGDFRRSTSACPAVAG